MFIIETVSGTTTRWRLLATSACFSPAVRRETPPAPRVIQLQCPAVIRWDQPPHQHLLLLHLQPLHQPLPLLQAQLLLLKVLFVNVFMLDLIPNDIQHSSSLVAIHLTVLVTPWRCISPPRASTVSCQTCLETRDMHTPWRR